MDDTNEDWWEFNFTFKAPVGVDIGELQANMADTCASLIGCNGHSQDEDCPASWVATCVIVKEETV